MEMTRRAWVAAGAGAIAAAKKSGGLRIGATDWNLKMRGQLEAIAFGKSLGFEGVEVSLSRVPDAEPLLLDERELQDRYLLAAANHKMRIAGTCLLHLNQICLVSEKLAQKWLASGIGITARLKARVILIPFFTKCELKTPEQADTLVGILKEHAPAAEKAGVMLGLENYLSAEDNVRIMDRVGSKAVRVYYDVKNATDAGFDPVKELRWLGSARICQIHLKDKGYLGEGVVNFPAVIKAIEDIGYQGFANLETNWPSGSVADDMRKNLSYIRGLMR
jgi:sugar phosphate isomerase/epimerase